MEKLFFIDVETTGLEPDENSLLELGIIVTNKDLALLNKSSWLIKPIDPLHLEKMVPTVKEMHQKSGLLDEVQKNGVDLSTVSKQALNFLQAHGPLQVSPPLCGSSVHFDRKFLKAFLPEVLDFFHYRNIDVSTIKELFKVWCPNISAKREKNEEISHRALDDLEETIKELAYYKRYWPCDLPS